MLLPIPAICAVALLAGAATASAASPSCTTARSGVVTDFCLTPSETSAGSDATLQTTIDFKYSQADDTVKAVSVTLAPGLLAIPTNVPATCTSDELTNGKCPAASQVGSGSVVADATALGLPVTATASLYAMAVPQADASTDVAYFGIDAFFGTSAKPLISLDAPAQLTLVGGQPAVQLSFGPLPQQVTLSLLNLLPVTTKIQVKSLSLAIDGTAPSASGGTSSTPFTRLPTSCSPATTTLSVDTWDGSGDGSGASTFTPTACGSLPFSPVLSASSTQDSGDPGVSLTTTVTQPPGQAAPSSITLALPAGTLQPDLANALGAFNTAVGSASAVTPLLSAPLSGSVTLTGTVAAPTLTIALGPPAPLTLVGSVDLATNSVTFSNLPDVPLSSLTVSLNGGSSALYASTCSPPSGTVAGDFIHVVDGQNVTATSSAPLTVGNCTASPPATGPPCTTRGGGDVSHFCLAPTGTRAGSDPTLDTTIDLNYADATDSVKDVAVTLPPGLLAIPTAPPGTCTDAQLAAGNCPAGSQVGSGIVAAKALGLTTDAYSAMYAMAVPASDAAADVAYFGIDSWLGSTPPKAGTAPLITLHAPASLTLVGGQPAVRFGFSNIPDSVTLAANGLAPLTTPIQVQSLTLDIDGTTRSASGATSTTPFTRLPTSCSQATTSLSIDTYAGTKGSGSSTFTPSDCASLTFTPSLTASSARDPSDLGASLSTTVTQPAGQAAISSLGLTVPAATLAPDVVDAATSFGDVVGSATAVTPLLSAPLSGTVTLTGNASSPTLTITIPPPVPLTLTGTVDLASNAVAFSGLPDVPLSSLTVTVNGGSDPLYATSCASPAGTIAGSFTSQSGVTLKTGAPFSVSGCPLPAAIAYPYTPPSASSHRKRPVNTSKRRRPPRVMHGSLSGLAKGHARLRFTLIAGSAKLRSFTVTLPRGLGFAAKRYKRGFSIKGAKVRSLRLRRGRLLVVLRSPARRAAVRLSTVALNEVGALRSKVRRRKVKFMRVRIFVRDASRRGTTLRIRLRV